MFKVPNKIQGGYLKGFQFQLAQIREDQEELEPRFILFYWYTSTVTSTTTTFTKTTTFTIAICTPASFAYSACG
jgi:hypothetical protein